MDLREIAYIVYEIYVAPHLCAVSYRDIVYETCVGSYHDQLMSYDERDSDVVHETYVFSRVVSSNEHLRDFCWCERTVSSSVSCASLTTRVQIAGDCRSRAAKTRCDRSRDTEVSRLA